jgi:hypothetical protein
MSLQKISDYLDVPLLHVLAISITFTDVENILKITSLVLAISYTIWKWQSEYKKRKK